MNVKELLSNPDFKWINIFARDMLLVLVMSVVHVVTHFNSKSAWFISGMLVVFISWQFSDFKQYKRLSK